MASAKWSIFKLWPVFAYNQRQVALVESLLPARLLPEDMLKAPVFRNARHALSLCVKRLISVNRHSTRPIRIKMGESLSRPFGWRFSYLIVNFLFFMAKGICSLNHLFAPVLFFATNAQPKTARARKRTIEGRRPSFKVTQLKPTTGSSAVRTAWRKLSFDWMAFAMAGDCL